MYIELTDFKSKKPIEINKKYIKEIIEFPDGVTFLLLKRHKKPVQVTETLEYIMNNLNGDINE